MKHFIKAVGHKAQKPIDKLIGLENSASKVAPIQLGAAKMEVFEFEYPTPEVQDPNRAAHHHGISHLCFRVDDIQAEYQRFKTAGIRFNSEPVDIGDGLSVYGRDPFGNLFELKG